MKLTDLINHVEHQGASHLSEGASALIPAHDLEKALQMAGPAVGKAVMSLSKDGLIIPKSQLRKLLKKSIHRTARLNSQLAPTEHSIAQLKASVHNTNAHHTPTKAGHHTPTNHHHSAPQTHTTSTHHPAPETIVTRSELEQAQALADATHKPVTITGHSYTGSLGTLLDGLTAAVGDRHQAEHLVDSLEQQAHHEHQGGSSSHHDSSAASTTQANGLSSHSSHPHVPPSGGGGGGYAGGGSGAGGGGGYAGGGGSSVPSTSSPEPTLEGSNDLANNDAVPPAHDTAQHHKPVPHAPTLDSDPEINSELPDSTHQHGMEGNGSAENAPGEATAGVHHPHEPSEHRNSESVPPHAKTPGTSTPHPSHHEKAPDLLGDDDPDSQEHHHDSAHTHHSTHDTHHESPASQDQKDSSVSVHHTSPSHSTSHAAPGKHTAHEPNPIVMDRQANHFEVNHHPIDTTHNPGLNELLIELSKDSTHLDIDEAFKAIGSPLPEDGTDLGDPVSPDELKAGDLLSFEGKKGLFLGNDMVLLDGKIVNLQECVAHNPQFHGFFHPSLQEKSISNAPPSL